MTRAISEPGEQREVLLLAFHFPPSTVAGTFRTLRFARYLPQSGWRPRVVTARHRSGRRLDRALLAEVPAQTAVSRVPCLDPLSAYRRLRDTRPGKNAPARAPAPGAPVTTKRLLSAALHFPDHDCGWAALALAPALRQARRPQVRVIWSTGPPWTTHLLGLMLKRLTGKPWVADFRDPWCANPARPPQTAAFERASRRLEQAVTRSADVLTAVTQPVADYLEGLSGRAAAVVLPNGWDADEFAGLRPRPSAKFTLTHAGSLYSIHDPSLFLEGVRRFVNHNGARRDVRVRFVGSGFEPHRAAVARLGLEDVVESAGPMGHHDLLGAICSSHVLAEFLTGDERLDYCIPCKLYEYLAARRPILLLARESEASRLIARSGLGTVVPPDDPAAVAAALERLYREHKAWREVAPDAALLQEHEARALTRRLAGILDALTGGTKA